MKVHEFDRVVKKLGMETRDSSHHHAWFVHDGVTVARTKRSHGNNKFIPEHLIRKQLHVDQREFSGLISCSVNKQDYIKILIDKGVIPKEAHKPEVPSPAIEPKS
jgi:hypothetical protein